MLDHLWHSNLPTAIIHKVFLQVPQKAKNLQYSWWKLTKQLVDLEPKITKSSSNDRFVGLFCLLLWTTPALAFFFNKFELSTNFLFLYISDPHTISFQINQGIWSECGVVGETAKERWAFKCRANQGNSCVSFRLHSRHWWTSARHRNWNKLLFWNRMFWFK